MQDLWSNENKQLAAAMWRDGQSISDIAKIFYVTRSAMPCLMSRNRDMFPHHHNKCCGYQGISIKYRSRYDRNIIRESA